MIAVVDYGVNNLASVARAFAAGGHPATLTADPDVVRRADRVVLPGVGHFARASRNLDETGLGAAVREVAAAGRPVFGICLGLQLMFEHSEEALEARGIALLPGRVRRFQSGLPVPHVGWARVEATAEGTAHAAVGPLFQSGPRYFYHVHSYHPELEVPGDALATADYGGPFATLVGCGNVLGAQFHPEKSQQDGLALLAAFAEWVP